MREPPAIAEEHLRACLQTQYGLAPATVEFLPLGWDTNAGVYRATTEQGAVYAIKVTTRPLYEPAYLVPRYLHTQGIADVVAPLPTTDNCALWTQLDGWRLVVYPFIAGDTGWATITDAHWRVTGAVFRRIHQVAPPPVEALQRETFDPTGYARWIRAFDAQPSPVADAEGDATSALRAAWRAQQSRINEVVAALETQGAALQGRSLPYVICHADLHASNLIRDQAGAVYVIDWDEVMLAPKERDFLFVGDPSTDGGLADDASPFFQGYGLTDIDWTALTYFRYERVAQDIIAYAEEASLRDDLGEATRAEAVVRFESNLSEDGYLVVARRAARHLPAEPGAGADGSGG